MASAHRFITFVFIAFAAAEEPAHLLRAEPRVTAAAPEPRLSNHLLRRMEPDAATPVTHHDNLLRSERTPEEPAAPVVHDHLLRREPTEMPIAAQPPSSGKLMRSLRDEGQGVAAASPVTHDRLLRSERPDMAKVAVAVQAPEVVAPRLMRDERSEAVATSSQASAPSLRLMRSERQDTPAAPEVALAAAVPSIKRQLMRSARELPSAAELNEGLVNTAPAQDRSSNKSFFLAAGMAAMLLASFLRVGQGLINKSSILLDEKEGKEVEKGKGSLRSIMSFSGKKAE